MGAGNDSPGTDTLLEQRHLPSSELCLAPALLGKTPPTIARLPLNGHSIPRTSQEQHLSLKGEIPAQGRVKADGKQHCRKLVTYNVPDVRQLLGAALQPCKRRFRELFCQHLLLIRTVQR